MPALSHGGQFSLFLSLPESQGSGSAQFDPLTFETGPLL